MSIVPVGALRVFAGPPGSRVLVEMELYFQPELSGASWGSAQTVSFYNLPEPVVNQFHVVLEGLWRVEGGSGVV